LRCLRRDVGILTDAFGAELEFALRVLAYGGVYLAGGFALKILPLFRKFFLQRLCGQGRSVRFCKYPIAVVLNEDAPIWRRPCRFNATH